jgi:four helix bundle protein
MGEVEKKARRPNNRPYNLEERTFLFAKETRNFVKQLPRTSGNLGDIKQLVRSSGSIGANYIEANEAVSKKDFVLRIKTRRKESKESAYWLRLLECGTSTAQQTERNRLTTEARERMNMFGAILRKSE